MTITLIGWCARGYSLPKIDWSERGLSTLELGSESGLGLRKERRYDQLGLFPLSPGLFILPLP